MPQEFKESWKTTASRLWSDIAYESVNGYTHRFDSKISKESALRIKEAVGVLLNTIPEEESKEEK